MAGSGGGGGEGSGEGGGGRDGGVGGDGGVTSVGRRVFPSVSVSVSSSFSVVRVGPRRVRLVAKFRQFLLFSSSILLVPSKVQY